MRFVYLVVQAQPWGWGIMRRAPRSDGQYGQVLIRSNLLFNVHDLAELMKGYVVSSYGQKQ